MKLRFPLFSEACEHSAGLGRKTNTRKRSDENLPASHVMPIMLLEGFILLSFQDYRGAALPPYVKVSSVFVCPWLPEPPPPPSDNEEAGLRTGSQATSKTFCSLSVPQGRIDSASQKRLIYFWSRPVKVPVVHTAQHRNNFQPCGSPQFPQCTCLVLRLHIQEALPGPGAATVG